MDLKLYPSGFMGSALIEQSRANDVVVQHINMFFTRVEAPNVVSTSSSEITELFESYFNDRNTISKFDTILRFIKIAKEAFGTDYLESFIKENLKNNHYSTDHSTYIDDTINYVYHNKKRQSVVSNDIFILRENNNSPSVKKMSEFQDTFFKSKDVLDGYENRFITIEKFVLDYIRRDRIDFINFMFVLFGGR